MNPRKKFRAPTGFEPLPLSLLGRPNQLSYEAVRWERGKS